ncbi:ParB family protein [Dickeya fangzhongdai]|uniref:ParB family protein n=1 Tax=Dickeya fangzhongdai TaxID=1778540 RepID=UPI0026E05799|nr:ParB family protein [Dickeya fangzhongdai]WKV49533.1 ParB family protein [Dickeya fangzhongdai]
MPDISVQDLAGKLLNEGFTSKVQIAEVLSAPVAETAMIVTLDELSPYEFNPRLTRNPLYDEIKASIRERGLDSPPTITQRPGAKGYIIRTGGNTRLSILRELWSETKDECFYRIPCLFRPWPERGDIIALTGHLAEDELHGGLSFIERALGVNKARELYEQEAGKALSQSELARRLKADGYPVSQPHISRMQEAIQYLLPAIPTVLYAGLGRHQVEQLTSLRRAAERIWSACSTSAHHHINFITLFQDVLVMFDSTPESFSVQRVQDELIGQMADLLEMEYDTLAFEITDSDRRWQLLSNEAPLAESGVSTLQGKPPLSAATHEATSGPTQFSDAVSPTNNKKSAPPALPPTEPVGHPQQGKSATENGGHAALLQQHVVSPANTTKRLQSIQRLVANHTGETLPDFERNVLQSIPIQADSLYPITDIWYIETALDEPARLRTHIAQFAAEIAHEVGAQDAIEPYENGIGFSCQYTDDRVNTNTSASMALALLHALSTPYLPATHPISDTTSMMSFGQLGYLLQGIPDASNDANAAPQRLNDSALVKLFRLLRLARRLIDMENGRQDDNDGMSGS